jgi:hypothetical protein
MKGRCSRMTVHQYFMCKVNTFGGGNRAVAPLNLAATGSYRRCSGSSRSQLSRISSRVELRGSIQFWPDGVDALDDRAEDHRCSMESELRNKRAI